MTMWLKVQPEGNDQLAFTWGNVRGPYPCTYHVGRKSVLDAAAHIRAILEKVAKWSQLKDPKQLELLLRDLMNEGRSLRFVIFDSPAKASDVLVLQDWIAEQYRAGDRGLDITADSNLYIPWGFVFDDNAVASDAVGIAEKVEPVDGSDGAPPGAGIANDRAQAFAFAGASAVKGDAAVAAAPYLPTPPAAIFAEFSQFWSLKFKLSMVFSASGRPAKSSRPRASYKLLSIINPAVLAGVPQAIQDELKTLFKEPVGVAYNLERCEELILQAARNDTLIHFFGHCRGGHLDLGNEKIDPTRFKMMVEKLLARRQDHSSPYNLIFLNACETLTGELDESFRNAAARPGLCGIVATEASVPQSFAADFGLRFLKSMLKEGNSIGDTMEALRRDPALWPLNLLYSCYAFADYRIEP
jgi:hypothetical protein